MVDMLWEVAYGVFKEALCLNSLEDFNATEADLMELKDDILTTWKSRDKHRTSSLGPTFTPPSARASEKKSMLGDTSLLLVPWHQNPFVQAFSPAQAMAWGELHHLL